MQSPIAQLDRMIRERHLLKHPFYTAWAKGDVPLETLRDYAGQYYQFESNFPRYVAGAYARITNARDRRTLLDNLVDEEGRRPTHPELWLDFARSLGMSVRRAATAEPKPGTRALLQNYEKLAVQGDAPSGLGALYAYESIFPEVAAEKSRGLREQYGIRSKLAHEFFRVHTFADREHALAERRLLMSEMRRSPRAAMAARRAASRTVGAWWDFLDGFGP
jgi:pyrroloquinoline-quinone synthase